MLMLGGLSISAVALLIYRLDNAYPIHPIMKVKEEEEKNHVKQNNDIGVIIHLIF